MCPDLDTILPTKNEVCFYELQFGNGFFFSKNKLRWQCHHFVEPLVLPVLDFHWLCPWILKPGWMHHWFTLSLAHNGSSKSTLIAQVRVWSPILHLGMVRLLLERLHNVTVRAAGRFEPTTPWPRDTLYRLCYGWCSRFLPMLAHPSLTRLLPQTLAMSTDAL